MLKIITPNTAIKIQRPVSAGSGLLGGSSWEDIVDGVVFCEWKNKFGSEAYKSVTTAAQEPASVRLWYLPGVSPECRVVRLEDGAVFGIVSVDDVMNRHQQLELEIKRVVAG